MAAFRRIADPEESDGPLFLISTLRPQCLTKYRHRQCITDKHKHKHRCRFNRRSFSPPLANPIAENNPIQVPDAYTRSQIGYMWAVMMVGMIVPSAVPMTLIYAGVARKAAEQGTPVASVSAFVAGYVLM